MAASEPAESLTAVIESTSAMLMSSPPTVRVPWLFTRCWLLIHRYEQRGRVIADLDLALADFDALPAGVFGRGRLAATLAAAVMTCGELSRPERMSRAQSLAVTADADPDPLPTWPAWAAQLRANRIMHEFLYGGPGFDADRAQAEFDELAATAAAKPQCAATVELLAAGLRLHTAVKTRDLGLIDTATRDLRMAVERLQELGRPDENIEALMLASGIQSELARGDVAAAGTNLSRLAMLRGSLPPDAPLRLQIDGLLEYAAALPRPPGAPLEHGDGGAGQSVESAADVASHRFQHGLVRLSGAGDSVDEATAAVADLRQAVELIPAHDPRRPSYLTALGVAYILCYENALDPDDLAAGITTLEAARAAAGQDQHSLWTVAGNPLAHAYRLAGRRPLSRATALEGLRGHAWAALLQSRPTDGTAAAAAAGPDAIVAARWCLKDGDTAGAVAALEAGRGLTLHAAMAGRRSVEDRLVALSRPDLAAEWREAQSRLGSGYAAAEMRARALTTLGGLTQARLLDPPSPLEVQAALTALELDALVYLVPGDDGLGFAVIVPAAGEPSHLRLPGLHASSVGAFGPITGVRSARDLHPLTRHGLDEWCDWAGNHVMGPVLDALPLSVDRPLRLALVPMRELGRVPWHAGRVDGQVEYVIHRATVTYAVSARMLCEAACRSRVPLGAAGLIVADPVTGADVPDLPAARTEAAAIRTAYYPHARYLGRADDTDVIPDGTGTPDEVLAWLRDPDGGAMLHLAVHGAAVAPANLDGLGGPDPGESSYVLLAGGRLVAETLVDTLVLEPGRDIGLAVLAGCRTGEPTRTYDEAFSIGTALLAAGVRTVVSAQWNVPDAPTSMIMYLLHHFLRADGMRPADALRAAQLAMLGVTPLPPSIPDALVAGARRFDLADASTWAGFFHSGQ